MSFLPYVAIHSSPDLVLILFIPVNLSALYSSALLESDYRHLPTLGMQTMPSSPVFY